MLSLVQKTLRLRVVAFSNFAQRASHRTFLNREMSQIENSSDSDPETVPGLRRFHTFEPARNTLVSVQRDRETYLQKSLLEKAEEARWRISEVITINDLASWPEYAEDLELTEDATSKGTADPNIDLNKKIFLWQGDITKLHVDAIVNAANNSLLGGGGVDGAIHRTAGSKLVSECRTLNGCETGDAKLTAAYLLPSKYVIHTVGPVCRSLYGGVSEQNKAHLKSCYRTCLEKILAHNELNKPSKGGPSKDDKDDEEASKTSASEDGTSSLSKKLQRVEPCIRSVAYPCISTGVYGYPQEAAAEVALKTVRDWLEQHPDELEAVIFCVFLDSDVRIYEKLLPVYFPLSDDSQSGSSGEET